MNFIQESDTPPEQNGFVQDEYTEEEICLYCGLDVSESDIFQRYRVCPECRYHYSLPARHRINLLSDQGSFRETNRFLISMDPLSFSGRPSYQERILEAQRRTGLTEAVITGKCTIGGNPTAIAVLDFGFMGGNMGCVVGEKISLAFEMAYKQRLPMITVVSSGGTRMQEGMLSLMQMAKTTAATKRLHTQRLPYISILTNPTSGEVYASFANLGDIIIAEPNALIGFAPLRIVEQVSRRPLPEGIHTTEYNLQHGMIDEVIDRTKLHQFLSVLLDLLSARYRLTASRVSKSYSLPEHSVDFAWKTIDIARHEKRPTTMDYISMMTSSFIEIRGDRRYADDRSIICGLADFSGQAVVIIGHERSNNEGRSYPEGFRKAQRCMRMAAKFGLPLITLIDTPGAYSGIEAEERGMGQAIASTLALMSDLPTHSVSVIIGEGGSDGAIALGVADRILMMENAIYSIISPEGAASISYRDPEKAEEMAMALKLTAIQCKDLEVIDCIVPEPEGGAHIDPNEASRLLRNAILRELLQIQQLPLHRVLKQRYKKFRRMGECTSYFRSAVSKEVTDIQHLVQRGVSRLRKRFSSSEKSFLEEESIESAHLDSGGDLLYDEREVERS